VAVAASYRRTGVALIAAGLGAARYCALVNQQWRNAMWKKLLFCLVSLASLTLSACNTIQGAGEDIEHAGHKIQSEAQEHKRY
jgi:predicted small secreted protein